MHAEATLDLTETMERLIDEQQEPAAIMRALLDLAQAFHQTDRVDRFAIGDGIYSLHELRQIQELEEHDAFVARHRA